MEKKSYPVICRFCGNQCHLIAKTDEAGQVARVCPDRDYGTIWCHTGKNVLELTGHKDRVKTPLKRTGEKGENRWTAISWEQAFKEIGENFKRIMDTYGRDALLGIRGYNKPYFNALYERLFNLIGTVNSMGAANMCHMASMGAYRETFGFAPVPRITDKTKCIVLWGSNPYHTNKRAAFQISSAQKRGAKLIVIDPCRNRHAREADLFLPVQAGTDMLLALGMIRMIIAREWYDKEFVEKYTEGFNELKEYVKQYDPGAVSKRTGISMESLEAAAKMIALEKPGVIFLGNAMDHNFDGFQKCRAIDILLAITGNIDLDGAMTGREPMSDKAKEQRGRIALPEKSPFRDPTRREKIVGYSEHFLDNFNESSGVDLAKAIQEGDPYPVKAAYVLGGNPAMIWENRNRLTEAFKDLEFMVVTDFFLTPTAMMADIVLPAATYLEYESVYIDGDDNIYYSPNLFPDSGQKSDLEILNEMGKSLGYTSYFWNTMEDYWREFLDVYHVDLDVLRKESKISAGTSKEGSLDMTGRFRENGFPTDNGKIHIFSRKMKEQGNDPLPVYHELLQATEEYPYISTNYKSEFFYHTAGRMIQGQRKHEKEAVAFIGEDVARETGIRTGDILVAASPYGEVEQRAEVVENMARRTVALAHGWWYPEEEKTPFDLRACSNNIVPDDQLRGRELPSFTTRGVPCKIYKKKKGN